MDKDDIFRKLNEQYLEHPERFDLATTEGQRGFLKMVIADVMEICGKNLRDDFASKALPAVLMTVRNAGSEEESIVFCAETAYKVADAMIKARND